MEAIVAISSIVVVIYGILTFMVVVILYSNKPRVRCQSVKSDRFFRILFGMVGMIFLGSAWLLFIAAQLALIQEERLASIFYMLVFAGDLIFYIGSMIEAVR